MSLFLGLDAGATKTAACIIDANGNVKAFELGPPGNWEVVGPDEARESFAQTAGAALATASAGRADLRAAVLGVAGVDWPEDHQVVSDFIRPLGFPAATLVTNDAFPALRAGAAKNIGCVSCAGTGSVTGGRNAAGETFRTLAVGVGENAGAVGLVRDALEAVARAHHGDGPPTALTVLFLEAANADSVEELFRLAERENRRVGPEIAPLVLESAAAGDAAAVEIAERAGCELARTAASVAARLELQAAPFTLVRAGAVHLAGSAILDRSFEQTAARLLPTAEITLTRMPPAAGAALLAIESTGGVAPFETVAGQFDQEALPR